MKRLFLVSLVVWMTACGGSEPAEGSATGSTSSAGAEEGATEGHRTPGSSEHECHVRQMEECSELTCRWDGDPVVEPSTTASEDPSLRDDVTVGPRLAYIEGEGRACVQTGADGATAACPTICCSTCPRE